MHYYFADHLGTLSEEASATGTIENDSDYYPYGGERVIKQNVANEHYKFGGKEWDSESGLDEFGARYYGSTIGRFMTPDWAAKPTDVPYAHYGNPQSLNLYSYVQNNPTTVGDPDGHQSPDMVLDNPEVGRIIDNAIGIVVGVATAAYVDSKGWIKDAVDGYGVGVGDDSMIGTDPVFDRNYFLSKNSNASNTNTQSGSATDKGPVKAKDAPGVTAGGQATNEHGQKLGPNGKPQVNNVNKNTREKAKNAANKGSGTIEDTNPKRGDPHFHTKRGDGTKKRDNVHYNYPR